MSVTEMVVCSVVSLVLVCIAVAVLSWFNSGTRKENQTLSERCLKLSEQLTSKSRDFSELCSAHEVLKDNLTRYEREAELVESSRRTLSGELDRVRAELRDLREALTARDQALAAEKTKTQALPPDWQTLSARLASAKETTEKIRNRVLAAAREIRDVVSRTESDLKGVL